MAAGSVKTICKPKCSINPLHSSARALSSRTDYRARLTGRQQISLNDSRNPRKIRNYWTTREIDRKEQTSKLNASLTKLRQQELSVEEYVRQTAGDERVRPIHKAHDGKKFQWDNPRNDTGHPGTDINCRCVAVPVLEGLLDI